MQQAGKPFGHVNCCQTLATNQCCRFSRNTAQVTPKIIYFYYQKIYLHDQSIQKINNLILKKTSLLQTKTKTPIVIQGDNHAAPALLMDRRVT